jgi:hypothetical protein
MRLSAHRRIHVTTLCCGLSTTSFPNLERSVDQLGLLLLGPSLLLKIYKDSPSVRHQSLKRLIYLQFAVVVHTAWVFVRPRTEYSMHSGAAFPMAFCRTQCHVLQHYCELSKSIQVPQKQSIQFCESRLSERHGATQRKDIVSSSYTTEWHLHGYLSSSLALTRVIWPC